MTSQQIERMKQKLNTLSTILGDTTLLVDALGNPANVGPALAALSDLEELAAELDVSLRVEEGVWCRAVSS